MKFLTIALVILVATVAFANTSNVPETKVNLAGPVGAPDGRVGGETMATATVIASLPYSDTGSTVGHIHDYDAVCPYTGSTAPDVVYKYVAAADINITVDLCASTYDTKVYIFQDVVNNVVACNDDAGCGYSGWQSMIDHVDLPGGHTYYIIVDGYGTAAGSYSMSVIENPPCILECPPGAMVSAEPNCYDGYYDVTNGGCNSLPYVFESIPPAAPGGSITLCGTSGTYIYAGWSYRDTDWFELNVVQTNTITFCCEAEFPVLIFFIQKGPGEGCSDLVILSSITGGLCQQVCLTQTVAPGTYWLWVGPSVFTGIPCDKDYIMTVDGYEAPSAVDNTSWGTIKALYR